MNMDDVEREFWGNQREQPTRVRLARVVRAIRDGMVPETQRPRTVSTIAVRRFCDEILASAGEGEAAGDVNPDGARISGLDTTAPAASGSPAAAPSVCEWKALSHEHFMRQCSKYPTVSAAGPYCSNCGKIIVEAR